MTYSRALIAAAACLTLVNIQAQDAPRARGESRLPKGIRGLEEGQAKPPSANWLINQDLQWRKERRASVGRSHPGPCA